MNDDKATTKKEPNEAEALDFTDSCFSKSICSSMDCTGLIPALPSSEAELEAYEEMYQFCLNSVPEASGSSDHSKSDHFKSKA
ncbi:MAG: hypothetical protein Q4C61_17605 [Lachnospiraceae bacterium]|nr:hypothetical protein [Lachnospiraceae bacterium]